MKQLKITKFPALDYAGNEAFNTLSTNLSFAGASVKKIMITSCHAAEGKSYLSMNLMRTLAQRGIKVALVDADLRRSTLALDTSKVDCDYYNFLRGSRSATNSYRGEYMTQYSWAEVTRSALRQQANVQKTASIPSYYVPPTGF
ncbi:MAG: hypothetical protein ACLTJ2_05010 [Faecalibacterium sp.]|uniref:nucleotide-binding protein n=1 Tax=Faecalibacterium sp. TaxID=1971605 RepID=UPI00399201E4